MIWFKDTENRIIRANKRMADRLGRTVSEIEGKTSAELFPHEPARFYAADLEIINSGTSKLGMLECYRDGAGQERWAKVDKVPVGDPSGRVVGIIVMAQDFNEKNSPLPT